MSSELAMQGWKKLNAGDFEGAWEVFDELVAHPSPDPRGLNNALWSISDDNSGRGVQPERAKRYLAAARPHGPGNPAIFYTGACLWIELGETERCLEWIDLALAHDLKLAEHIRGEAMFAELRGNEAFEAIFARHLGTGIDDTDAGKRLLALAGDLGDDELVEAVRGALKQPPRTVETIGFYPGSNDNDEERCYRFLVSQLGKAERLMTSEDKYSHWLFEEFAAHVELPAEIKELFGFLLDEDNDELEGSDPGAALALAEKINPGYLAAMQALEAAFEATGRRLRTLWTGPGDTLHWILLEPEIDERWCGVAVVQTHDGESLGVRKPAWERLAQDLGYATGIPIEV